MIEDRALRHTSRDRFRSRSHPLKLHNLGAVRQVIRKPAMLFIQNPQIGKLVQKYRMIHSVESFAKVNKHSTNKVVESPQFFRIFIR